MQHNELFIDFVQSKVERDHMEMEDEMSIRRHIKELQDMPESPIKEVHKWARANVSKLYIICILLEDHAFLLLYRLPQDENSIMPYGKSVLTLMRKLQKY